MTLLDCVYEGRSKSKGFGRYKTIRRQIDKPLVYKRIPRKFYHYGITKESFVDKLSRTERPDLILITSGMTYWYLGVKWCIDILRNLFSSTPPILLGGIYAQLCPDHAHTLGADGVQTVPLSIDYFYPALDLYEAPNYGITMTSIGCPLSCKYCASKKLWSTYKRRPLTDALEEIAFQENIPTVKDIAFYDDALLINKESHFYHLCLELQKKHPHLRYHTPNGLHVREIDETCARYLYETGFKTIRLSLEGNDPAIQKASSGKVHEIQYAKAVRNLLRAGYSLSDIETYILVGLPGQSCESVQKSIKFVKSSGATVKLAEYSPIPGTPMFEECAQRLPILKEEPLYHNNTAYCGYISQDITAEDLQSLKDLANNFNDKTR
ncbi:radical SAM protein [Acetomicrobium mobile]|uniref:B12-binding domain-containing radical SAM protein n=1 Tax=Acetomicrobium mobile TaxID=97477 RepID=UPI0026EF8D46|nr:radical SAM protein [Acetomicrobium mobile]